MLSWAISSGAIPKDFLLDFFFFPPLWFLRLLRGWPDEDGGFGVLAEVEPGPRGCRPLDESIGADKPRERVSAGLANQAGWCLAFNGQQLRGGSARGTPIAVLTKTGLSSAGSTTRRGNQSGDVENGRAGSRTRPAGGLEPRPSGGVGSEDCCSLWLRAVSCRSAVSRMALLVRYPSRRSMVAAKGGRRSHGRIFNDDGAVVGGRSRRQSSGAASAKARSDVSQTGSCRDPQSLLDWLECVSFCEKNPHQLPTAPSTVGWGVHQDPAIPRSRNPPRDFKVPNRPSASTTRSRQAAQLNSIGG
jgi:hypothetical protein